MATDYAKLSENLRHFYSFGGKVVLYVGAAGRQLLDPATRTKKVIAIDRDVNGWRELKAKVAVQGLQDSIETIAANFEEVTLRADVVYSEFCFHELEDPEKALIHAKSLASDIVVYDHAAGSEWIYYGAEENCVARSSAVMEQFGIRRRQTFQAEQGFADYAELLAKVRPQGPLAIERIQRFTGAASIVIPMSYELNLL